MVKMDLPDTDKKETRFKKYDFETAKNLYDVLLNFSDTMDNRDIGEHPYYPAMYGQLRWIFRGHWEYDWDIIPSAFRKPDKHGKEWYEKFRLKSHSHTSPATSQPNRTARVFYTDNMTLSQSKRENIVIFKKQIEAESILLRNFMATANSLGIECNYTPSVYTYENELRDAFTENNMDKIKDWPDSNLLSVMALAQHHGLPTRLLDFSYNALFAAFFAAKDSFDNRFEYPQLNKRLCIWAIDEKKIMNIMGARPDSPWQKIPAPTNRSSNIFAQEGLLILDTLANERFLSNEGEWQDLISMEKTADFVNLTLPQSESKELLRLLWEHDIKPAKINPNLDIVTETLEYNHWLWTEK